MAWHLYRVFLNIQHNGFYCLAFRILFAIALRTIPFHPKYIPAVWEFLSVGIIVRDLQGAGTFLANFQVM
jgi:hypothetical protein